MLIGIGSTLAAFGAFLALVVALAPPPRSEEAERAEYHRRQRIAALTITFAAVVGFVGAALLITSAWPWSVVAIGGAALLYMATMVVATHTNERQMLRLIRAARDIDKDPDGRPGRIWTWTAVLMKVAPDDLLDDPDVPPFYGGPKGDPGAINLANGVQRAAEERALLSWALSHPFGAGMSPRSMLRFLILRLRYRLEQRR